MKYACFFIFSTFLFCTSVISAQNIDVRILHSVNKGNSKEWDKMNKHISQTITPFVLVAPCALFTYSLLSRDSIALIKSCVVTASIISESLLTTGLKYAVQRKRPFITYPGYIIKKDKAGSYSFPSGHTSAAFSLATSLSLNFPKWYIIAPSFLWASAVGYSRMELGVHYTSDVLVGAIVGAGSSYLMWKLNKFLTKKKKRKYVA